MQSKHLHRSRSVEFGYELVRPQPPSLKPAKLRVKIPSMMDIGNKQALFKEFLKVNNLLESGFFEAKDLTLLQMDWEPDKLALIQQRLLHNIEHFASTKEKFLEEAFESGEPQQRAYHKLFKNVHNYYLLSTLLNCVPEAGNGPAEGRRFAARCRLALTDLEMDSVLKPVKCRICYGFVPIWLYVEHSNNCFGLNTMKNELLKVNQTILGLCENIKDQASKINYEQLVKDRKFALERESQAAGDKKRVTDLLLTSLPSNRKSAGPLGKPNQNIISTPAKSKEVPSGKNGQPNKSVFSSYKNEQKADSNDPSFTGRVQFLKQKTNVLEEIRSVNAKHNATPSNSMRLKCRTIDNSKKMSGHESSDCKNGNGILGFPAKNKITAFKPTRLKRRRETVDAPSSSEGSNKKDDNSSVEQDGATSCVGDMFDDDHSGLGGENFVNPFRNAGFPTGRFPRKTLTDYKVLTNTFNLDSNDLKGSKRVDSQRSKPRKVNESLSGSKNENVSHNICPDESQQGEPNSKQSPLHDDKEERTSDFLVRRFNGGSGSDSRSIEQRSPYFASKHSPPQTHSGQQSADAGIKDGASICFNKVFSFKQTMRSEDNDSKFSLHMFEVKEEPQKQSVGLNIGKPPNMTTSLFKNCLVNVNARASDDNAANSEITEAKEEGSQAVDDEVDTESREVSPMELKKIKERVSNLSGSVRFDNASNRDFKDGSEYTPSATSRLDEHRKTGRDTFQTFGRTTKIFKLQDRSSINQVATKFRNFMLVRRDSHNNDEEGSCQSSQQNSANNGSCVGDMFDTDFGNADESPHSLPPSNALAPPLLIKALHHNKSRDARPGKRKSGFESENVHIDSRSSFTTTVKPSSFYHMHRNSNQNISTHSSKKSLLEKGKYSALPVTLNENQFKEQNIKNQDADIESCSPQQDSAGFTNFISKNLSTTKDLKVVNHSTEDLKRLRSMISKGPFDHLMELPSKTSLCFEGSVAKLEHPSNFKPSTNDLSPIGKWRPHQNFDVQPGSKELSYSKDISQLAMNDATLGQTTEQDSSKVDEKRVSDFTAQQYAPTPENIFHTTARVSLWRKMHKATTDYRKAAVEKLENFDDYYMYLFNKEVQRYRESLLTNPYLQNFFADQEMASKIEEFKAKINRTSYIDTITALQAAVVQRMELVKESRRYQSNIEEVNNQASGRRLVRENFSRSYGNLSVLDCSQDFPKSNSPEKLGRQKENFMIDHACRNSNWQNSHHLSPAICSKFNGLILPKINFPAKRDSIFMPDGPMQKMVASPLLEKDKSTPKESQNTLTIQNKQPAGLKKMLSQLTNESAVTPTLASNTLGAPELAPTPSSVHDKKSPQPTKINNVNNKLMASTTVPARPMLKRCHSDSEFVIQAEREKIYIEKTRGINLENFNILKELGKGAYGTVYLVSKKSTQDIFALKTIKFSQKTSPEFLQSLQNEISILSVLKGDFLAQAYFSFVQNQCLCIVMEYLVGGDFRGLLEKEGRFDEAVGKHYIAQLVLALEELHKNKIVHRDLKPENLLLDMEGRLKLADFGLSEFYARLDQNGQDKEPERSQTGSLLDKLAKKVVGTPDYIPPEILFGYDFCDQNPLPAPSPGDEQAKAEAQLAETDFKDIAENEQLVNAIDWWGVGCLLYEFLIGVSPFSGMSVDEVFSNVKGHSIAWPEVGYGEDCVTPEAKDLIDRFLDRNPYTRLGTQGTAQIKAQPFFNGIDWNSLANKKAPLELNFDIPVPKGKTKIKMSTAIGRKRADLVNESCIEPEDLTMNRVDLLFEMNIKQFKALK